MVARLLIFFIRLYQKFLSPFFGRQCRFYPTCSHYSAEAILRFGAMRGTYLMIYRILRCNPWCEGGFDPVPEQFSPWPSEIRPKKER